MAVANPYLKEDWEEWKREMEENRRRRWRERVRYRNEAEVSDNEEDEEAEDTDSEEEEEEDVTEDEVDDVEVKKGNEGDGEVMKVREAVGENEVGFNEGEEEGDSEDGRKVEGNEEVDEKEEKEVKRGEDLEDGEEGGEKAKRREVEESENEGDEEDEDMKNTNKKDEDQEGDNEVETYANEKSAGDGEEEEEMEAEDGEEEQEVEETAAERQYRDPEDLVDPEEQSWISEEEEDPSERCADEEETSAEYWTQDDLMTLEEEDESTDDEEAEQSTDEDVNNDEEDVVKIYFKEDYLTKVFVTLREFRASSLLTDLTLSTWDGTCYRVHAPVLAAVSAHIRESLSGSSTGHTRGQRWTLSLGPEVDRVGLEAVVEFAYTGLTPSLNQETLQQIKAAAETLGALRVLDLCAEEEEKPTKAGRQTREERLSAEEQMRISLQSIDQLRMEKVGCDVILEALGGSLHVHRVILAVWSDYFRSMFTLEMKESHQPCVTLPLLLASELEVLIDCSYSGALPLSWSCVFELTSTALQLQYQPALALCLDFLQQEINPRSCLDVASFAEAYEMAQLLETADDFVLRQFQKVACTSKFKDLPARQLLRYLHSHSLCVSSELVVFKAVVAWIQAKPNKRLKLAKELMKTIHFPLMTFEEFSEVQSLNMWSDHSLAELYEAVFKDFCSYETAPQSQWRMYLPKESLVLIGGDQTSEDLGSRSISRELWFGNSLRNHTGIRKAMEWRKLGEMPNAARYRHEVAVLRGQLYVFGGKKYYGTDDTLNSVYRFDPLHNSWESLAEMQQKRCSFSAVVLDGKIHAIGGHSDPDYIGSVERYCPAANSWSFTRPLNVPLSAHVAKVLRGQIFVSGGLSSNYQCLASLFVYDPQTGSTYLADMVKPRAHHCMETLGECLYVAGGITADEGGAVADRLACEVYNPAANSWTAFRPLPVPHVGAGSAVLEGKFYVLGGYSQEDYSDTNMVHRYDPSTQRWENMGKMPGPNNDIRAALLGLPPHLRV